MSKSKRTQQRYREANRNQSSLTSLGFTAMPTVHDRTENISAAAVPLIPPL
jgi:hypothetical protein